MAGKRWWIGGLAASICAAVVLGEASAAEAQSGAREVEVARLPDAATTGAEIAPGAEADENAREVEELCHLMTSAADAHGVPHEFFIRLIWKESRFDPSAVSPVGAQGIAQFMPATARARGLDDPFDREEALFASASFLSDLAKRFGSWGLAAAGYNGGPNRVPRFVAGEAGLPTETRDYVFTITGRTAEYWARRAREADGENVTKPQLEAGEAAEAGAVVQRIVLHLGSGEGDGGPAAGPAVEATADEGSGDEVSGDEAGADRLAGGADDPAGAAPDDHLTASEGALRDDPVGEGAALAADGAAAAQGERTAVLLAAAASLPVPVPRPSFETAAVDCADLVDRLARARAVPLPSGLGGGWTPWGAQVAGHPNRAVALRQYERLKAKLPADLRAKGPTIVVRRFAARGRLPIHAVMFSASGQAEARAVCRRIASAPCVVVKNR